MSTDLGIRDRVRRHHAVSEESVVSEEKAPGIASRLRAARARLGWSREELAFHSGVSWSAITQAESGRRRNLRPATISALCGALGISMDYLVNGDPSARMLTHRALLYEAREDFAESAARFVLEGIGRSESALVLTGKRNTAALRGELGSTADQVEFVDSARGYAAPHVPHRVFTEFVTRKLRDGAVWVRIVGEPPFRTRPEDAPHWTRYESLLNLIFAGSPMTILCPYDAKALDPAIVSDARHTHPELVQGGETTASPSFTEPGRFALGG
jgi:transcriptional regulator with XRE-family HTH domain